MIRYGNTVRVARQVVQHVLRSAERRLGVDHPLLLMQRPQERAKHIIVRQGLQCTGQAEFTFTEHAFEPVDELGNTLRNLSVHGRRFLLYSERNYDAGVHPAAFCEDGSQRPPFSVTHTISTAPQNVGPMHAKRPPRQRLNSNGIVGSSETKRTCNALAVEVKFLTLPGLIRQSTLFFFAEKHGCVRKRCMRNGRLVIQPSLPGRHTMAAI